LCWSYIGYGVGGTSFASEEMMMMPFVICLHECLEPCLFVVILCLFVCPSLLLLIVIQQSSRHVFLLVCSLSLSVSPLLQLSFSSHHKSSRITLSLATARQQCNKSFFLIAKMIMKNRWSKSCVELFIINFEFVDLYKTTKEKLSSLSLSLSLPLVLVNVPTLKYEPNSGALRAMNQTATQHKMTSVRFFSYRHGVLRVHKID
jgi:hypothetical protein